MLLAVFKTHYNSHTFDVNSMSMQQSLRIVKS